MREWLGTDPEQYGRVIYVPVVFLSPALKLFYFSSMSLRMK